MVGRKGKLDKAKFDPIVHDAMEMLLTEGVVKLYERMDEFNSSQLLKFVQIDENIVLPKVKPQDDRFIQEYKDNLSNDWSMNRTRFLDM